MAPFSVFVAAIAGTIFVSTEAVLATATGQGNGSIYRNHDYTPRERAQDLLSLMTWQEKVGQLGGIRQLLGEDLSFNETKYETFRAVGDGTLGFGWALNSPREVLPIVSQLRAKQVNSTRLGIPYIIMTDSVNGPYLYNTTLFPGSLSMASSWNIPLYGDAVAVIRDENLALGVNWVLSPELDLGLDPRNGRVGEMYGEDPFLTGTFGTKYVQTVQQKDEKGYVKVAATIKHFVYGQSSGGVNTASINAGMNHIMNQLAVPYMKVIKEAHPLALMASYAAVDEVPMSANHYLLQDILRVTLGYDGLIMSDAGAIINLFSQHKVAYSESDAAILALEAGLQQELSPGSIGAFPTLLTAVNNTKVASLVDEAVTGVLEIKFATGQFDLSLPTIENLDATVRSAPHLEIARNMSREAIVLLENKGILPLTSISNSTSNATKVAVLGPFATVVNAGSYAGNNYSDPSPAFLASIENRLGAGNVHYVQGVDFVDVNGTNNIEGAVAAAKDAGLAIVTVGSLSVNNDFPLSAKRTDGEFYAHAYLDFPGYQQQLIDAVIATGVPTIVVISGGQAFALYNSTLQADAILHTFLGGEFTGDAIVEILFGDVNPSGKLTVCLPQVNGAFPIYYDYLPSDNEGGSPTDSVAWQFPLLTKDVPMPFGYGLSYTTFNISTPQLSSQVGLNSSITISTTVTNTGNYTGKEVVQLYFRQLYSRTKEVPVRKLIRFEKVELAAGESRNVTFEVRTQELGYYLNLDWRVDEGIYTFWIGNSSRQEDLKGTNVTISG